jgi:hypothetical protein
MPKRWALPRVIETWPLLAALASAVLPATWNAKARASAEPVDAMAGAVILSR